MRVLLTTWGGRGDVEPVVGLAERLQARGAQVRLCVPRDEDLLLRARESGAEVTPLGPAGKELMRRDPPPSIPETAALLLRGQVAVLPGLLKGCDAAVITGALPAAAGALSAAEAAGVPAASVTFQQLTIPAPDRRRLPDRGPDGRRHRPARRRAPRVPRRRPAAGVRRLRVDADARVAGCRSRGDGRGSRARPTGGHPARMGRAGGGAGSGRLPRRRPGQPPSAVPAGRRGRPPRRGRNDDDRGPCGGVAGRRPAGGRPALLGRPRRRPWRRRRPRRTYAHRSIPAISARDRTGHPSGVAGPGSCTTTSSPTATAPGSSTAR